MAKKKVNSKRKFASRQVVYPKEVPMGFFSRFKDVIPPQQKKETVRVKTFIVEKPVYVPAPRERMMPPAQKYGLTDEDYERYDARKSRYAKRKDEIDDSQNFDSNESERLVQKKRRVVQEEELDSEAQEGGQEVDYAEGDDQFEENPEDQTVDDEEATQEEMPVEQTSQKHVRSRGMFLNSWWKKALLWAFVIWLGILLIELGMHAMKLIQVDLTRQWWVLLGGLIFISMIYFKFFEGKIKL
jgi:hypothetical protein